MSRVRAVWARIRQACTVPAGRRVTGLEAKLFAFALSVGMGLLASFLLHRAGL